MSRVSCFPNPKIPRLVPSIEPNLSVSQNGAPAPSLNPKRISARTGFSLKMLRFHVDVKSLRSISCAARFPSNSDQIMNSQRESIYELAMENPACKQIYPCLSYIAIRVNSRGPLITVLAWVLHKRGSKESYLKTTQMVPMKSFKSPKWFSPTGFPPSPPNSAVLTIKNCSGGLGDRHHVTTSPTVKVTESTTS